MSDHVRIVEVGPRDGLQNAQMHVSVDDRIDFINDLSQTGLFVIEAGALVSPKWVPQMAGSDEVYQKIQKVQGISYPMLVPNEKGLERAIEIGVKEIALFVAASETFSQKNINKSIEESMMLARELAASALSNGMRVRAYISCVMGCPYEGAIAVDRVSQLTKDLLAMGCYEVSLGDTIGVGVPTQVRGLIAALKKEGVPVQKLALHCHDTYGTALANIYAGYEEGVRVFDSSAGGLGGCPYAKGASGNVASEDLIHMFHKMGVKTGVDFDKFCDVSQKFLNKVKISSSSKIGKLRA
ncbi:MAG: hydroxymethylglutaryl-CoA lyase [Alphaproteobacteria bacterium]|nr:hydroxymethylglutaryl-CoA lyase [Alphaproteobacteria bacterium]MBP9878336.1 hydroxymethylglutaryl-CoA lyase [Alphaproteobacteria bacterium]